MICKRCLECPDMDECGFIRHTQTSIIYIPLEDEKNKGYNNKLEHFVEAVFMLSATVIIITLTLKLIIWVW